jgi:hypothetical protein
VPGKITVDGDNAIVTFSETDSYTMVSKGKTISGKVISGWTIKLKKTKAGWRAYDFVEHFERNVPNK